MNDNLLEKLTSEIQDANWQMIEDTKNENMVICLSDKLELIAAGIAMARDEVNYVQKWLTDGDMFRPTEEQIAVWKEEEVQFQFLIIQPYVLIQIKKEDLQ